MRKRLVVPVLAVLFFVSIAGCSTMRLTDFTLISTKNVDLARGADFHRGQERITGEDKVSMIIIIPTGTPNIKQAIDRAIESVPGAVALLDGVLSAKSWYIPFIYGEESYVVEGTPLIDPKLVNPKSASAKLPTNYIISKLDKKDNAIETRYVSGAEFSSLKKRIGA